MFDKEFSPVLRFMVISDVHVKDEHTIERDRMVQAIKTAYRLSEESSYNKLDACYIVGDFADRGTYIQMKAVKDILDANLREETVWNVSLASHEFMSDGPEGAKQRLSEIFGQDCNTHRVINGFHFISVGCTERCRFGDDERAFAWNALKEAAADSPEKPIFFFQHPHIQDTVYGSIAWGEDELTPILCNFPQIIDFSGHSHAPVNDPRSIHQRHFTCLGTGTLSYFELDDFDKYYSTFPPHKEIASQMLIVEADKDNRVRVYPYDLITDNFFPYTWKIDRPWDVDSFIYTDARFKTTDAPYFADGAVAEILDKKSDGFTVRFPQAIPVGDEYVCGYNVYVKDMNGHVVRNKNMWSDYYFYDMPEYLSVDFDELEAGEYIAEIYAISFWDTRSEVPLKSNPVII